MAKFLSRRATLAIPLGAVLMPALPRLAQAAPVIGAPAPDFAAPDQDGTMRRLADFRGKVVVLEWTNHDCPFVRKHYGSNNMQALQKQAAERGLVWLSVISSPPGEQGHVDGAGARRLTTERGAAPAAVLLDPESRMARAYGATTTPHMYVIDGEGLLRYMGGIDSIASNRAEDVPKAEPLARNAMLAVADGRPVERAVTRNYGCAIKYAPGA